MTHLPIHLPRLCLHTLPDGPARLGASCTGFVILCLPQVAVLVSCLHASLALGLLLEVVSVAAIIYRTRTYRVGFALVCILCVFGRLGCATLGRLGCRCVFGHLRCVLERL